MLVVQSPLNAQVEAASQIGEYMIRKYFKKLILV